MYGWDKKVFTAPNGKKMTFSFRTDTNDWNTIYSAFVEDEYKISDLKFDKDDVVLDLGAHIGSVTLLLAAQRPDLKIYAFEPFVDNFQLLMENARQNNLEGEVNLFNQAVWFYDDDKVKMFYGMNTPDGKVHKFIGSQFLIHDFYNKRVWRWAQTISLSKIFEDNHIFNCKFMKMDVEGAEYGILKGTPKEVLEMIQEIRGEYHNIDPKKIKKPRKTLLEQTKGVFRDRTGFPEKGPVGPFVFVKKN